MDDVVLFYRPGGKYGVFSNFSLQIRPFSFFGEGTPVAQFIDKPAHEFYFSEKPLMLCKAATFGDDESFEAILEAKTPIEVKRLGRGVKDYDEDYWEEWREWYMYEILKQKFGSCPRLLHTLLQTGDRLIAEASLTDSVWGIGLSMNHEDAMQPSRWRGRNLLGNALMRTRDHFNSELIS